MSEAAEAVGDLRSLALTAGEIHGGLVRAITEHLGLSQDERVGEARKGIDKLLSEKLLTDGEADHLNSILDAVHDASITESQIATSVGETYETLKGENAGLVALVISGIAADSTRTVAEHADRARAADQDASKVESEIFDVNHRSIGQLDCEGGIVGATVGLLGGSPASVAALALVGAAAASVAAWAVSE